MNSVKYKIIAFLENRVKLHNRGNGAKCLRGKLPVEEVGKTKRGGA